MKKSLLLTAIFIVITIAVQAQKKVLLQHLGTPTMHNTIGDAIGAAVANDTIYIPGSNYNETLTINKKLTIIGAGHYPDSTAATGMTKVVGGIDFNTGCDGTKVEGIYFTSTLSTGSQTLKNISIIRCKLDGYVYLNGTIDGFLISECILNNVLQSSNTGLATNILVEKSVLTLLRTFRNTTQISHCVFARNYTGSSTSNRNFYDCQGVEFNSNVILDQSCYNPNTCTFKNNLFRTDLSAGMEADDTNNIFNQNIANIFEKLETGKEYTFDYANDYHLKAGSPGIGAALDGTNIGIYGTANPCKASAVPSNPHFFKVDIASENDADGKLSVKLGVQAQDR